MLNSVGQGQDSKFRLALKSTARATLPLAGTIASATSKGIGYLYTRSWGTLGITFFDHRFDHLRGPENWHWMERGVFGARLIPRGGTVLDLGCGDGIFSGLCYSPVAGSVDAIDRDSRAISLARKRYPQENVHWHVSDILLDAFPRDRYDTVFLFAVIEHFSVAAGTDLIRKIGAALEPGGTLLGSTPLFHELGGHNDEHDNEFFSEEYLRAFLEPHFETLEIWVSRWPNRNEAYFQGAGYRSLDPSTLEQHVAAMTAEQAKFVANQGHTPGA